MRHAEEKRRKEKEREGPLISTCPCSVRAVPALHLNNSTAGRVPQASPSFLLLSFADITRPYLITG